MNIDEFVRKFNETGPTCQWHILNDDHSLKLASWQEYIQWLTDDEADMRAGKVSRCSVGNTVIGTATVSTVFLRGVPHLGKGFRVHFFETMVFGGPMDQAQWRYKTWAEAAAGHEQVCAEVRASLEAAGDERSLAE
jgi:hypothetical protein